MTDSTHQEEVPEVSPLAITPAGRRYGYHRDKPDHRDFGIAKMDLFARRLASLPSSYSLLTNFGPVRDQGSEGSCTAQAGAGNRDYYARKNHFSEVMTSAAFLYYIERQIDGTLGQGDCGSTGRTVCQSLQQFGIAQNEIDPYIPGDFSQAPTPAQLADALQYRTGPYHSIGSVEDMKMVLVSDYPIMIGIAVYTSFESEEVANTGIVPMPAANETLLGGHEILVAGYDDSKSAFLVRNSWGASWGIDGNFWLPYAYAADPNLLWDAWVNHMRLAK